MPRALDNFPPLPFKEIVLQGASNMTPLAWPQPPVPAASHDMLSWCFLTETTYHALGQCSAPTTHILAFLSRDAGESESVLSHVARNGGCYLSDHSPMGCPPTLVNFPPLP